MLRQALVAAAVCACTITIHALIMTTVVRVAASFGTRKVWHPWLRLSAVMIATVSVLMAAHVSEVLVWALAYAIVDAAPDGAALVYFAFVNYTTLGYGDITPVPRWLLLGPLTAMNGILLFGWSTAVIFEVLRRTMQDAGTALTMGGRPE
jgi:ion channel